MSLKDEAKKLLNDKKAFDKAYDECFAKYDKNLSNVHIFFTIFCFFK